MKIYLILFYCLCSISMVTEKVLDLMENLFRKLLHGKSFQSFFFQGYTRVHATLLPVLSSQHRVTRHVSERGNHVSEQSRLAGDENLLLLSPRFWERIGRWRLKIRAGLASNFSRGLSDFRFSLTLIGVTNVKTPLSVNKPRKLFVVDLEKRVKNLTLFKL